MNIEYATHKGPMSIISKSDAFLEVSSFLQQVIEISGPIGITILTPSEEIELILKRPAPAIILLHDVHSGGGEGCDGCKENKGCLSLFQTPQHIAKKSGILQFFKKDKRIKIPFVDVLKKIANKGITVDFFYEAWYYNKCERYPCTSALFDVRQELLECAKDHMCYYSPVRIHLTDPRSKNDDCEVVFKLIANKSFQDFCSNVITLFPTFTPIYILRLVLERLVIGAPEFLQTTFLTNPFFKKHSVVYRQLMQLPLEIRTSICQIYHNYIDHIPPNGFTENDIQIKVLRKDVEQLPSYLMEYNDASYIFKFIKYYISIGKPQKLYFTWTGLSATLDIYYLSRTLKTPKGAAPSQLSVLYAGDIHCMELLFYLTQSTNYYKIERFGYDISLSKCVSLNAYFDIDASLRSTLSRVCNEFNTTLSECILLPVDRNNPCKSQALLLFSMYPVFKSYIDEWCRNHPESHLAKLVPIY